MLKILNCDWIEGLKSLPDNSVHCCVTSPPYWGLRNYFFDKASIMRDDLSQDEKRYVESELAQRGIRPRVSQA